MIIFKKPFDNKWASMDRVQENTLELITTCFSQNGHWGGWENSRENTLLCFTDSIVP